MSILLYLRSLMNITFYKYQGTGNDFVIIDNRAKTFPKERTDIISKLCHRNFGIGADGLILLEDDITTDFKMVYYNSDGKESTMCGNGGRCIVAFAHKLGLFKSETSFSAIDGLHKAAMNNNIVSLQMIDIENIHIKDEYSFLNTGSPHHVQLVTDISNFDVFNEGKNIRNIIYGEEGSNVNFVEQINADSFRIRTYERGVEDETLACGTGATAVAIAMHKTQKTSNKKINILVEGGDLSVSFETEGTVYKNVRLIGAADFVFSGNISI